VRFTVLLLAVALATVGCRGGADRSDSVSDSVAIRQLYSDLPGAVDRSDIDGYLRLLDDSVTLLLPGAASMHGVAAVRTTLAGMFGTARYHAVLEPPQQLEVAGSWAFVQYRGRFTTIPRVGDSTVARNRYLDILQRQPDRSWRLLLHSMQADGAPSP
jgi:ketosteroid isomerase-like protein